MSSLHAHHPIPAAKPDLQHVVNYTIVALVGLLGGIIIGYLFHSAPTSPSTVGTEQAAVPRPRALESPRP